MVVRSEDHALRNKNDRTPAGCQIPLEILAPLRGATIFSIWSGGFRCATTTGYYLPALRADPASISRSISRFSRATNRQTSIIHSLQWPFVQSREEHFPKLNVLQGSKIHRHSNSPQGEDIEVTITNRDRNALCVFLSRLPTELCQHGNLRLATMARSGA